MRCSNRIRLTLVVAAVVIMAGCAAVPPAPDTPAPEEVSEPALELVEEQVPPPLPGPMPPTLAVLEQFDEAVADMQAGRFEPAREKLESVLQSNPELVGAHVNLGIARLQLNDEPGAMQAFETALGLQSQHPVVLNQLAIMQRRAGRFDQALGLYEQALDGQPDYAPAHLNVGILCDLYLRQADCALSHYARYVALGGEQAEQVALWIVDLERREGKSR